jgi:hypothetical protein
MTARAIPASVARAMTETRASRKTLQLSALMSSMSANRKGAVKKWMPLRGLSAVLAYLSASWAILGGMEEPADREETAGGLG